MFLNVAGIGPAGIDPQVAALAPSQLAERLCERGEPGLPLGIVRGDIREHANAPHSLDLLRACTERPRDRAAEQRDELTSSHVEHRHSRGASSGHGGPGRPVTAPAILGRRMPPLCEYSPPQKCPAALWADLKRRSLASKRLWSERAAIRPYKKELIFGPEEFSQPTISTRRCCLCP